MARRSPDACGCWQDHRGPDGARQGPHPGAHAADDGWGTRLDHVNGGSGGSGDHEISTASITPDLSPSVQDRSLRQPGPCSKTERAAHRRGRQGSGGNSLEDRLPPARPRRPPAPSPNIDRSSLFDRDAARKLDTFFGERRRVWESGAADRPDTYNHTGAAPERPGRHWSRHGTGHSDPEGRSRRQRGCGQGAAGGGSAAAAAAAEQPRSSRETCQRAACRDPDPRRLQRSPAGKGRASGGLPGEPEGSRPSAAPSGSAWILPRCRISHVRRCRACQAFNREQPPAPYENRWSPLREEEQGEERAPSSAKQPMIAERLSKVQGWLERTLVDPPPGPEPQRHRPPGSSETPEWRPAGASPGQKEGGLRGAARDAGAAEAGRKGRRQHQPCEEASSSPTTCTCPFCEQQRPRAKLVSGKTWSDPSAGEVALRLQAENRIHRIVAAFERRSLWEAKMAEQERAFESAKQRDPEERRGRVTTAHAGPKRGHRSSSATAHRPHSKAEEEEEQRGQRGEARTRAPRGKEDLRARKCPSLVDRLRGIH